MRAPAPYVEHPVQCLVYRLRKSRGRGVGRVHQPWASLSAVQGHGHACTLPSFVGLQCGLHATIGWRSEGCAGLRCLSAGLWFKGHEIFGDRCLVWEGVLPAFWVNAGARL